MVLTGAQEELPPAHQEVSDTSTSCAPRPGKGDGHKSMAASDNDTADQFPPSSAKPKERKSTGQLHENPTVGDSEVKIATDTRSRQADEPSAGIARVPLVTLKLAMDRNGAVDDESEGPKRFTSNASLDAGEWLDWWIDALSRRAGYSWAFIVPLMYLCIWREGGGGTGMFDICM